MKKLRIWLMYVVVISFNTFVSYSQTCNITPGFTWKADSLNPYEIYFTNTSVGSGTLTARWFYGDNGSDSTWNATHVFAAAGTYYTCLRVQGDTSTCYKYYCDSITILPPPPPVCNITPGFTWKADSLNPYEIYFTNTSVGSGTLTARWFYGDNGSDSTWNATHVFAAAGTYYTCLRVQGDTSTCYKYFCDSITILPPPPPVCNITPGFTWKADSLNPYEIYFTNTSVGSGTLTARWFYGDNGADSTWNAIHVFAAAGTYYTCLRVQGDTSTCYKYFCDSITATTASLQYNAGLYMEG